MNKKTIGILAATLLITSTAQAAVTQGSYSVSPLLGGYVYGSNQQFNPALALGLRGGYNFTKAIGAEALYDYVAATDSKYWALKDISMQRFGVQGLYHFLPDNQLVPYLAAGVSGVKFSGTGVNTETHPAFDYGIGAKYFVAQDIAIRADLRHLLYGYNNTTYNNVELMVGATFQFGGAKPPAKAAALGTATASLLSAAAPVTTVATVPESAKLAPTPAPKTTVPAPLPALCPPPIETVKTYVVPVTREACEPFMATAQAVPKAASAPSANQGACSKPADMTLLFSYEKSDVKQTYYDELDKIGSFLKSYPGATVTIEGHTSGLGNANANLKLSQARAEAVKGHIMYKFGIAASRIVAKGYGLTRPVASNKTSSGRIQNRRIVVVFNCE